MFNSAITEPSAGSDVGSMKSTYKRKDGKIYLNGQKCFITSSLHTPYLVVMAKMLMLSLLYLQNSLLICLSLVLN